MLELRKSKIKNRNVRVDPMVSIGWRKQYRADIHSSNYMSSVMKDPSRRDSRYRDNKPTDNDGKNARAMAESASPAKLGSEQPLDPGTAFARRLVHPASFTARRTIISTLLRPKSSALHWNAETEL